MQISIQPSIITEYYWSTLHAGSLTAEDVVLVVLISLCANLDETVKTIVVDELMHQVLVILQHTYTVMLRVKFSQKINESYEMTIS